MKILLGGTLLITQSEINYLKSLPAFRINEMVAQMLAVLNNKNKLKMFYEFSWVKKMQDDIDTDTQIDEYIVTALNVLYSLEYIHSEIIINLTMELNLIYLRKRNRLLWPLLTKLNEQVDTIDNLNEILINIDSGVYAADNPLINIFNITSILGEYTIKNIEKMKMITNELQKNNVLSDIEINLQDIITLIMDVEEEIGAIYLESQTLKDNFIGKILLKTVEEYHLDIKKETIDKFVMTNKILAEQNLNMNTKISINDIYLELIEAKILNYENIDNFIKKIDMNKVIIPSIDFILNECRIEDMSKSFRSLIRMGISGDKDAQYDIGFGYTNGIGVTKNVARGFKWFKMAADQGHKNAQYEVSYAYIYEQASIVNTSISHDTLPLLLGNKSAEVKVITENLELIDNAELFENYKLMAERGDATAQYRIASAYIYGNGTEKNLIQGFRWYQKAAEQEHVEAQYKLGYCYEKGTGVDSDLEMAFKFYQKAATLGSVKAQTNLALCYEKGIGTTLDLDKAFEWYVRAAVSGFAKAQNNLGYLYENGKGATKNYSKAFEWYQKAAIQGHAKAQYNLALCYEYGKGVIKNLDETFKWFKESAEQGNMYAQYALGAAYIKGLGTKKDKEQGYFWYQKAAEQGHLEAGDKIKKRKFFKKLNIIRRK